jgi:gas vesicle protein
LQEDIDNRTVALSVKATKITAEVLMKAFQKVMRKIQQAQNEAQAPHGRQSVKKLMNHNAAISSIPLDGDTKLFDRVARKFNVDYSFHKTGPKKYVLLFKSGQADAITAAFTEFSKFVMARGQSIKPRIHEQIQENAERVMAQPQQRERSREAAHEER